MEVVHVQDSRLDQTPVHERQLVGAHKLVNVAAVRDYSQVHLVEPVLQDGPFQYSQPPYQPSKHDPVSRRGRLEEREIPLWVGDTTHTQKRKTPVQVKVQIFIQLPKIEIYNGLNLQVTSK